MRADGEGSERKGGGDAPGTGVRGTLPLPFSAHPPVSPGRGSCCCLLPPQAPRWKEGKINSPASPAGLRGGLGWQTDPDSFIFGELEDFSRSFCNAHMFLSCSGKALLGPQILSLTYERIPMLC